ncbi:cytochrome c oxidase subunit 2A [Bacillus sp. AGMB 02131]|uniref:Cytochrome c oxidase subunit 2A n=1 Tax=Peribacillus faecalis TaxID=2772559 RepID=A0A927CZB6_9BACI|nr:cytochrome c oxidase subunit 2A [Peribacillus faecalis]MBD3110447.1 cytochrome c oxidase subunit 2A [Peribacillus faecalis]
MAQTQLKKKPDPHNDEHGSLKGTLASVIILGLVIVITWVSVYSLFVSRL